MNPREKILVSVVAGLLVLFVGYQVVNRLLIRPVRRLNTDIAACEKDLDRFKNMRLLAARYKKWWRELAHRTLGADERTVQARFGDEITRLLADSRLGNRSRRPLHSERVQRKLDLLRVPFSVSAEGSLQNVTEFLTAFYERPYLAQITKLDLNPKGVKSAGQLKMSARVETIVLPKLELAGAVGVLSTNPSSQPTLKRYAEEDATAYAMIWEKQFLTRYEPPPPKPPTKPRPTQTNKPSGHKPTVPPTPRDNRSLITVMAVATYPGSREVITYNSRTKAQEVYRVGDSKKMDDGDLVMVHALGAVVRRNSMDYFYAVGSTFAEATPVKSETNPVIYNALVAMRGK